MAAPDDCAATMNDPVPATPVMWDESLALSRTEPAPVTTDVNVAGFVEEIETIEALSTSLNVRLPAAWMVKPPVVDAVEIEPAMPRVRVKTSADDSASSSTFASEVT